ncbi:Uncharacterised protein [Mycolicibacterium phlei]|nr:hypothetical protein GR01_09230 [Mycobacteroides chelonae]ANB00899.1 hypothetical protein BB28_09735 [Mycobacteroides chelonae CCUG 47445]OLT78070.1 hypothetical protein BKG56_13895 [Mycobacteroides chelonae]ORV15013.1 hypothetical protein AWB96_10860 [Mycobacteroides chelonae]VEG16083.1 Uncharacterised protein [Mycolicibacterium phlei]
MAGDVEVTFYVRYELEFGDGRWGRTSFGPTDEAEAQVFFGDIVRTRGPRVRNARIVRREERVIETQGS